LVDGTLAKDGVGVWVLEDHNNIGVFLGKELLEHDKSIDVNEECS